MGVFKAQNASAKFFLQSFNAVTKKKKGKKKLTNWKLGSARYLCRWTSGDLGTQLRVAIHPPRFAPWWATSWATISAASPDVITAPGRYPNRRRHQPHCIARGGIRVCLARVFNGPRRVPHNANQWVWRVSCGGIGTDKGRAPLRAPHPITLGALRGPLFFRSQRQAAPLCRLQCPSDLISAPWLTWSLAHRIVDEEEINKKNKKTKTKKKQRRPFPHHRKILIWRSSLRGNIISSFDFTELQQSKCCTCTTLMWSSPPPAAEWLVSGETRKEKIRFIASILAVMTERLLAEIKCSDFRQQVYSEYVWVSIRFEAWIRRSC